MRGSEPFVNAAVTTVVLVKAGQCKITGYHLLNNTAAVAFLQVFDAAAAADVTLGTTVAVLSLGLPASGGAVSALGEMGYQFTKGIVVAGTTTATGSSTASISVNMGTARA
jgi:hypothetical protein